jgi:hypothetical protein
MQNRIIIERIKFIFIFSNPSKSVLLQMRLSTLYYATNATTYKLKKMKRVKISSCVLQLSYMRIYIFEFKILILLKANTSQFHMRVFSFFFCCFNSHNASCILFCSALGLANNKKKQIKIQPSNAILHAYRKRYFNYRT